MWGWHNRGCLLNGPATKTGPMRGKDSRQVKTRKVCLLCAAECRTFDHAQDKNWERKKKRKDESKVPRILGPSDNSVQEAHWANLGAEGQRKYCGQRKEY